MVKYLTNEQVCDPSLLLLDRVEDLGARPPENYSRSSEMGSSAF